MCGYTLQYRKCLSNTELQYMYLEMRRGKGIWMFNDWYFFTECGFTVVPGIAIFSCQAYCKLSIMIFQPFFGDINELVV